MDRFITADIITPNAAITSHLFALRSTSFLYVPLIACMLMLSGVAVQVMPEFVTKIIQIFDCKVARHGNMIVGKTGAGKSVAWQTLQRAMARLRKDGHESEQFQKVCSSR